MRVSSQPAVSDDRTALHSSTSDRAVRAAHLLHEALALLGAEPQSPSHAGRPNDRLLRLPEVQQLTGLRRSALYDLMQRGAFPRSVKTGPRAAGWSEAAVQRWISDRIEGQPLIRQGRISRSAATTYGRTPRPT
ncbi:MAG: AlpA family transcriptional regulator [Burkholderiales bacterium]|nr:AlpA family transcriptional regulator [Burkholderiales bacterium]